MLFKSGRATRKKYIWEFFLKERCRAEHCADMLQPYLEVSPHELTPRETINEKGKRLLKGLRKSFAQGNFTKWGLPHFTVGLFGVSQAHFSEGSQSTYVSCDPYMRNKAICIIGIKHEWLSFRLSFFNSSVVWIHWHFLTVVPFAENAYFLPNFLFCPWLKTFKNVFWEKKRFFSAIKNVLKTFLNVFKPTPPIYPP